MASERTVFGDILQAISFRVTTIADVRDVSPHFRWMELSGDSLRDLTWGAGDKVQVHVGGVRVRTYTPLTWDSVNGKTQLLLYLHGATPGAQWGRDARVGERCRLIGPRRSLPLGSVRGPVVLFGDETSFALASTLQKLHGNPADVACVFEVSSRAESLAVLGDVGVAHDALVEKAADDAHGTEVDGVVAEMLAKRPGARLVMTGNARSIQALRKRLKARGVPLAGHQTKAYWAPGRTGLD